MKEKEDKYQTEVDKLAKLVSELNKELDARDGKYKELDSKLHAEVNERSSTGSKLKSLESELEDLNVRMQNQQKYSKYHRQIDEN